MFTVECGPKAEDNPDLSAASTSDSDHYLNFLKKKLRSIIIFR